MGWTDYLKAAGEALIPGVAPYYMGKAGYNAINGNGGSFSSDNRQDDPYANQQADAARKIDPSIGTYANRNGAVYGTSSANNLQTPLERSVERRSDFYYGGTRGYADQAAANAQQTGDLYAGQMGQNANDLNARANQVFSRGYGPEGPSAAQATLRQGTSEALAGQLALARSGRGMGESASALNTAQGNAVGLQTTAANNAAILRAQETEAYAQRKDAAQRANDQAALGYSTLGQEGYKDAGNMAFQGQDLANQIQTNASAANQAYEANLVQYYGINKGVDMQNAAQAQQQKAATVQFLSNLAQSSDERVKYSKHLLSPIEAKKERQPLSSTGSFGDPLSYSAPSVEVPSVGSFANAPGTTIAPGALLQPRRHAPGGALDYHATPSPFAQSLEASPDRAGLSSASPDGIVQPWRSTAATTDPWQKYLMDRDKREQEDHEANADAKVQSQAMSGLSTFAGLAGLGFLLAKSDARSKKQKRPIGRLAQDPIVNMPAISQRGVIMSDEKSKAEITRLTQENHNLSNALDAMAPHKQGADTFPRDYGAPAPVAPGDETAQLPRIDLAALNAQRDARALQNRKAAVTPGMAPAPTEPARAPTAKKQAGKQAPDRTTLEQDVWSAKKAAADAEEGARLGVPNPDFIYAPSHMMERQYNYDNAGDTGAQLEGEQVTGPFQGLPQGNETPSFGPRQTVAAAGYNDPLIFPVPYHPDNVDRFFGADETGGGWGPTPEEGRRYFRNPVDPNNAYTFEGGNPALSDERSKTAIDAIRAAPGYSYKYKQPNAPGAAPGTHYGPMAQDLEKTPMGASTVVQSPDGVKMVDTGRLALVNTAALHAQQDELDQLKQELAALRGKRAG